MSDPCKLTYCTPLMVYMLTALQYGVIKKIEHFWKGLSQDRTQISALPPEQYGDRFLNFMSGITMSSEEAAREAEEKRAAEAEAAAGQEKQRVPSWNSVGRKSTSNSFTAPTHQPPPPPGRGSGAKSPDEEETLRKAEHMAHKSERHGHSEYGVPEMTIKTTGSASTGIFPSIAAASAPSLGSATSQLPHGRDPNGQSILPVVQESGESWGNGERGPGANRVSHVSQISSMTGGSDGRPLTPAKDGQEYAPGFGNPIMSNVREPCRGPPTPPKTSGSMAANGHGLGKRLTKPESADSGIGVHATGRERSGSMRSHSSGKAGAKGQQMGRDSMDKALPPLPASYGRR